MSTFQAINFYNSFAYSLYQAAQQTKFYFNASLSVRRSRRLLRRPAAPVSAAVSSPTTTGGVIEEDIVMSNYNPFPLSVPSSPSPPSSKRARLFPPSTTDCTTTTFWCVPDINKVVDDEKNSVHSFFAACSTTACLSVSGVSFSVSLARDEQTMLRLEGIARQLLSLGVASSSLRSVKKRSFGNVW